MRYYVYLVSLFLALNALGQVPNAGNDPEAAAILQKVSAKYKVYKNVSANFSVIVQNPKVKPDDDERKLSDTLKGEILLQGDKFKISIRGQQIYCDGKNIWTYIPAEKEVQLNIFEESDDVFSPSKIFTLYKDGYLYQIKEKKVVAGKNITVIEMAPPNKKVTYFKIDISIDESSLQLIESKIYEKNGVRYIYKLNKQAPDASITGDPFTFDSKKHPGVKVVDLR